jgi:hypothetical protein
MEKSSAFRDLLILVGILPIERPIKIQQTKKRMGYPGRYLSILSKQEISENRKDTTAMFSLIK